MFQEAVLGETGGTRGGWSWEDSPGLHPPGWLGSGEDLCLIALGRLQKGEGKEKYKVYNNYINIKNVKYRPLEKN